MRLVAVLIIVGALTTASPAVAKIPEAVPKPPPEQHHQPHHVKPKPSKQERLIKIAKRYLGVRYVWGGSSPASGFDCSGYVRYVFRQIGVSLGRTTWQQVGAGRRVPPSARRKADLIFFGDGGHVGIVVGRNAFVHSPHSGEVVSIDPIAGRSIHAVRRVIRG